MTFTSDGFPDEVDVILLGLETGTTTRERVITEFDQLAKQNLGAAVIKGASLAAKIRKQDEGNLVHKVIDMSVFGLDSEVARTIIENYATGDRQAKKLILENIMLLLREKSVKDSMAVVREMQNPYLVGDIIRKYPILEPAFDLHAKELLAGGVLDSSDRLNTWLAQQSDGIFAATSVALQLDYPESVAEVIEKNGTLFQQAAHVVAASHDRTAQWRIADGKITDKGDFLEGALVSYVDEFADMVRLEGENANWLPLDPSIPRWGTYLP